jgi:hypothetical protein
MAKSKAHICPECGETISFKAYLTLPGEYRIECPNCKAHLQPEMNELNRYIPLAVLILIILTGINQRAGMTKFLIYIGVMTLIAFLVLLIGGYYFVRLRKVNEESE